MRRRGGPQRQDLLLHVLPRDLLDLLLGARGVGRASRLAGVVPDGRLLLFVPQGNGFPVEPPGILLVHQASLPMHRSPLLRDRRPHPFLLRDLFLNAESKMEVSGVSRGAAAGLRAAVVAPGRRKAPGTWPWD